jgi:hypothetical protein
MSLKNLIQPSFNYKQLKITIIPEGWDGHIGIKVEKWKDSNQTELIPGFCIESSLHFKSNEIKISDIINLVTGVL